MTTRQQQAIAYLHKHLYIPAYDDENPWQFDLADARWRYEERVHRIITRRGLSREEAEEIATEIIAKEFIATLPK